VNRRLRRRWAGYLFLLPYLGLFAVFLLLPLAYGLGLSFFRWEMISPAPPKLLGLGNYVEAFQDDRFWRALWATFRFVLMAVPSTVGLALFVALGIHHGGGRRQGMYRAMYFLPVLVSISVAGILWRWFYNSEFGLLNAFLGTWGVKIPWIRDARWAMKSIVFMTIWWTVGGPMVVFLAGLNQLPRQYYEAASIDGASPFRQFWSITLPLLRPVMLFVTVMNIIGSFQVFGQTFMITRGGPEHSTRVLVQYIYETAFTEYRMGYGAAMSWLLFVCIAVFSILQFRLMRER